jgi:hypothetical protein
MLPSVKTIADQLGQGIEREHGKENVLSVSKSVRLAMERAHNHRTTDRALDEINELLHGYGVESIRDNEYDRYYGDIGLLYVNMGDTYAPTIIYDTRQERFLVASWGDIVEGDQKRFTT